MRATFPGVGFWEILPWQQLPYPWFPWIEPSKAHPALFRHTNLDSNFGGVQIGTITYSWRSMPGGIENVIKYCNETGISSIELMSNDLEEYLGAPKNPMMGMFSAPPGARPPAGVPPANTPAGTPPANPPHRVRDPRGQNLRLSRKPPLQNTGRK